MELTTLCCLALLALVCTAGLAAPDERPQMRNWATKALLGEEEAPTPAQPGLAVKRQDHGAFRLRRSVMDTPLRLGDQGYAHGLGAHAVSEIQVRLPRPGKQFTAAVGVDNNYDTGGKRGSVEFVVEVNGQEKYHSAVCRGGEKPVAVAVALDGAQEFTLRVTDAGDGPGWDQADWADAAVTLDDGARLWLDALPVNLDAIQLAQAVPFSFLYDGKPSANLLPGWKRQHVTEATAEGRERHRVTYTDPDTGLEITSEVTLFTDFPAAEWVLHFRNTGMKDTPILEAIRPLALDITMPVGQAVTLHHAHGSTCANTDFIPLDDSIAPGTALQLAPNGGRSSDGQFPFFNLDWGSGGLVGAIGWSGQWEMRFSREKNGNLRLQAGQQTTHLLLHPGESIRTPRMLLLRWEGGDRLRGHNLLRRLLLAHYVPRRDGEIALPPVTQNTWFTFNEGNAVTEENQLEAMRPMAEMGVEDYWLDAGWFEGGWPAGAGSWDPKREAFPRGLKPLGDAAHRQGMGFVVWFEPERVNGASRIAREHPEWVLHAGDGDGLFNLGDPAACAWLTDMLSQRIRDWGIDIFRNDFNIDPLRFWQAADTPERRGMAEIRYIEGLYSLWDSLRQRRPGLLIDNCASGGRRIDLETISRSFPLWHSDTQCCGRAVPVQDQTQASGLNLYVPLHAAGVWSFDPYPFRSVATTGVSLCMDTRGAAVEMKAAQRMINELKQLRPLYLGDYYPLLDNNADERQWCAWQFDRPELGRGFALFFRRERSPYAALDIPLRGLDPDAEYRVAFPDSKHSFTCKGSELSHLRVAIDSAPGSVLVTYERR